MKRVYSVPCGDDCQGTWDTVVLAHRGKEDILYVHVCIMRLQTLLHVWLLFGHSFSMVTTDNNPDACGKGGVCQCIETDITIEVDCSGGSIHVIPRNIPSNTISVAITYTHINEIPDNAFSGLSKLQTLTLSNNEIAILNSDSFHGIPSTTRLMLSNNNLSALVAKQFEGMPLLEQVFLRRNKIQSIQEGSFDGLVNLLVIELGNNKLTKVQRNVFEGLQSLVFLYLDNNRIQTIQAGSLQGLTGLWFIYLQDNFLQTLPEKLFEDLSLVKDLRLDSNKLQFLPLTLYEDMSSLSSLELNHNELNSLPAKSFEGLSSLSSLYLQNSKIKLLYEGTFQGLSNLDNLRMSENEINILPKGAFTGMPSLQGLYLDSNQITTMQVDAFQGLVNLLVLDLSKNDLPQIGFGVFNQTEEYKLTTLMLQRNQIKIIKRDDFLGLDKLEYLCLFSNQIHTIEDNSFHRMNLRYIYLFQNNLTNITGNPFGSNVLAQLQIYRNEIKYFALESFVKIPINTTIYLNCNFFDSIPRNLKHDNVNCVSPSLLPSVRANTWTVDALIWDGFECDIFPDYFLCTPCGPGTYGDQIERGCHPCPIGGFYQDEIAQTRPKAGTPCKLCNPGTYVIHGHGTSAKECEVCPEGTNQSRHAGYRACYCKDNYARMNRYGPCFLCLEEGLNCSHEFQSLLPGYAWNWSFPYANISYYEQFVVSLRDDPATAPTNYTGEVPRIFKCPRLESCANDNESISGNCAVGYRGWLCTNCQAGYYSVLTLCVPCPTMAVLIAETCIFFFVCGLSCFLLSWQFKRNTSGKERTSRSFIDVIIARIKILLGFYQVVGEIFTSLHNINWSGPLVVLGKFIAAFEINILRLFVRPRCFDEKLDLNPKIQFLIGAILPVLVVLIPFTFYQAKKVYVFIRFSLIIRISYRSHFEKLKTSLFACVVVLWFLIYPPVCSVIFSLYPISCKAFSLNQDKTHNITRLRSDFDTDCAGLRAYHISAFILTITYVIAFPAGLLYLLHDNHSSRATDNSTLNVVTLDDESVDSSTPLLINDAHRKPAPQVWIKFFCESYKTEYWFWEIIELSRKVTQTLLITLFGWEDRLTVILTTCISVSFLLLHARCRPMNSSYEQGLQMFSLTVIFINVIVAANHSSDDDETTISVILVVLNIFVLMIIAGELLLTMAINLKNSGIAARIYSYIADRATSTIGD
ncbi:uncharacterized protein [Apostichopus japonicus]|uniref:uncharacterized protein isoform X3 n=1 Tax=Stichopus japonicus TaxID=307972 RepID=UPI003AB34C62